MWRELSVKRESLFNWLALLTLLSLGIVWPAAFAGGATVDEVRSGSLLLKTAPDAPAIEALRVSTRIRAQVTANVARVRVTQQFTNPGEDWVEGLYVFPLAAGAAVDELEMQIGERRIRGEIKRKAEARTVYEQAKSEGKHASLVDQERPNLFTTSVANIAPHSAITIEIAYLDTVPCRDGRYTLNLPLAITPRYTPGAGVDVGAPMAADNARTMNAMLGTDATPERVTSEAQAVDIEVQLAPGFALGEVKSLHHATTMSGAGGEKIVTLQAGSVPADRDFELEWAPAVVPDVQAAAFAERTEKGAYVLLTLTPPEMTATRVAKREVVFIIDTSGSMSGPSIEQARVALQMGVARLSPGDRFNVIRFSSDATSLFEQLQPVNESTRSQASRFIGALQADGGTEMRTALELAFETPPAAGALRQIIFVTDGSVSNESELVTMIHESIGHARLFTVGIGAAPNAYFMREAAAAGRGSYTFIAQIDQVGARMTDLFRKLEQPALVDLELSWPDGMKADLAANLPGDLYAGDPLIVAARLPHEPHGTLTLSGRGNGGAWVRQLTIENVGAQAGIAKVWARERIADLSRQRNFGADAAQMEQKIVDLALAHHLVSEFTSLVAVDVTPVRPMGTALNAQQAPTAAPVGGAWAQTTGFARTGTPAPLLFVLGLGALGLAFAMRRREVRA